MSRISRYFFSLLLLMTVLPLSAQDTVKYDIARTHGLRLGVDISRLVLPLLYDDNRFGLELTLDKQVSKDIFATVEAGYLTMDSRKKGYHYEMNGSYFRVGGDLQIVRYRFREGRDHVYGGIRYGFSSFTHQASDIEVPAGYWPGANLPDIPSESLSSHWLEFVAGIKVELARRLYLGAALRGKRQLVAPKSKNNMDAINVPGYGPGADNHTLSLSYSILYMFGPY
ncbi:MAG: DUF6048 family protein [Bacteroidales bacterium]|nr:DUF6048 family protein [Bacteroidales bacterium]